MKIPLKQRLMAYFWWPAPQALIAGACATFAWTLTSIPLTENALYFTEYSTLLAVAGIIAAILTLTASLSIGHVLQYGYATVATKSAAFSELHQHLQSLENYLNSQRSKDAIIEETRAIVWDVGNLRLEDFPIRDWSERISGATDLLDADPKWRERRLHRDIIKMLNKCEQAINQIGVTSIQQIIMPVLLRPVIKMFFYLSLLLVVMASLLFVSSIPRHIANATIVFFATMTILLLFEVVASISRDFKERLDFIDCGDQNEDTEEEG